MYFVSKCNTYVFTITYPLINRLQIKPRTTCLCYFDLPIQCMFLPKSNVQFENQGTSHSAGPTAVSLNHSKIITFYL